MRLDQRLVDAAIEFTNQRFPGVPYEGAAAVYTADGQNLISTALAVLNDSVALCQETGAICEAYAKDLRITASVCVSRSKDGTFLVLASCGVCQERLRYWGPQVEVAVPSGERGPSWKAVSLAEVSPHYWRKAFDPDA